MLIQSARDISAPAATVWEILGERFGEVAEWASAVEKSSLDGPLETGAVRTCDLKAFGPVPPGQITEELTGFDREARAFTFVVRSGLPGVIRHAENTYSVETLGPEQCRVSSRAVFRIAWWMLPMTPILRKQLARGIRSFISELDSAATSTIQAPTAA